ncbi:MAG: phospholipase, partial [Candidatus Thermofonsia bacterium]
MAAKYPVKNLAFQGGGVKTLAYQGALKVLEEKG